MRELVDKEREKDATIALAQRILEKAHPDAVSVIKHWITIIQSRWDEVSTWAKQVSLSLVRLLLPDLRSGAIMINYSWIPMESQCTFL